MGNRRQGGPGAVSVKRPCIPTEGRDARPFDYGTFYEALRQDYPVSGYPSSIHLSTIPSHSEGCSLEFIEFILRSPLYYVNILRYK